MKSVAELLGIKSDSPKSKLAAHLVSEDRSLIGELIRLRHQRGLKQHDVADLLGISQSAVAGFERLGGDPRLSTIRRYAMAVDARIVHIVRPAEAPEPLVMTANDAERIVKIYRDLQQRIGQSDPAPSPLPRVRSHVDPVPIDDWSNVS